MSEYTSANVKLTWISLDAEVEEEGLDDQQDIRHRQAGQGGVHLPAEAKHLIGELCIHSTLQQDMQIDEHVVPAIRSKSSSNSLFVNYNYNYRESEAHTMYLKRRKVKVKLRIDDIK